MKNFGGINFRDESSSQYKSFEDEPQPSSSSEADNITQSPSSISHIFCVHGSKYGIVNCDELHGELSGTHADQVDGVKPVSILQGQKDANVLSKNETHCHTERESGIDKKARQKLILASVVCLFFMIMEIIGGVWANSLAIATDAAHLLTDLASFMISLFSLWLASRPSTKRMSFGWHRAEVIGATVSVLLIWVVTGILVYAAALRIVNDNYTVNAIIMLITSAVGVAVNIIMGCSLHQPGHDHGENKNAESGEVNQGTQGIPGKEKENINVKAAFIHVIGDFVQSIGVFTAANVIFFKPEWKIVDPICTFVFSILVLATTISILRNTITVLMEGIPNDVNIEAVQNTFLSVPGLLKVHNLRIWSLTTDKTALSAHLVIGSNKNGQDILKEASMAIREKYDVYEMTLQVERSQNEMENCRQCKD